MAGASYFRLCSIASTITADGMCGISTTTALMSKALDKEATDRFRDDVFFMEFA